MIKLQCPECYSEKVVFVHSEWFSEESCFGCEECYVTYPLSEMAWESDQEQVREDPRRQVMREILFRGKRLDNGKWVYGDLKHDDLDFDTDIVYIYFHNKIEGRYETVEVDPATVGQFTGIHDKNGKRIFEGDIVTTDIKRPVLQHLIVEFRDGCFMFNCNDGGEDYYDIMLPTLKEPQTVYKYGRITGNIYD